MSFITIEHTAASWIDKQLTKVLKLGLKSTSVVYSVLTYASTLIEVVVGQIGGTAAEAESVTVLTEVLSLLAAAKAALYDVQDVTSIGTLLDTIVTNLSTILTDAHITNSTSVALITKVVKALDAIVKAIDSELESTSTTTTTASTATATA